MKYMLQVLSDQIRYFPLIFKVSMFDLKGQYRMHYLGILWEFVSAVIQIAAYWFVFGVGIRGGAGDPEMPYIVWLMVGIIPWFFISSSITQGSKSIISKVNLVSKMKFPTSILPSMTVMRNSVSFFMLSFVVLLINYFIYDVEFSIYLIQLLYYFFCMVAILFALGILLSTISIIIRDFVSAVNSVMRMLFFTSPVLWDPSSMPPLLLGILQINPFYYVINGIRDSVFYGQWFFEEWPITLYFWSMTLLILLVGSFVHMKFRSKFVDYL